jgi:hypothetical protein
MSADFEERLGEWAVWYCNNVPRLPEQDLRKQMDFMKKAVDGCFELLAMAAKDIQFLERRDPLKKLYLPKGVTINGSVKEFG